VSWLPPPRQDARRRERLWQPPALAVDALEDWAYVVIDEIEDGAVGLAVSDWPYVDAHGRIRFPGGAVLLGAYGSALARFLARHRRPQEIAARELRAGDVFAVRPRWDVLERVGGGVEQHRRLEPLLDPSEWIEPPVYDVTADAREAAKTSFYASVTPTLDPERARELAGLSEGEPL
jgi:hypothetical protein